MLETQETQIQSLGGEDPLEESIKIQSNILAWKIPWTEDPGVLQPVGSPGVRHDWACTLSLLGPCCIRVYFTPTFPLSPLLLGLSFQSVKCQNPYGYTHRGTTLCLLLLTDPFSFTIELFKLDHICSLLFFKFPFFLLLLYISRPFFIAFLFQTRYCKLFLSVLLPFNPCLYSSAVINLPKLLRKTASMTSWELNPMVSLSNFACIWYKQYLLSLFKNSPLFGFMLLHEINYFMSTSYHIFSPNTVPYTSQC